MKKFQSRLMGSEFPRWAIFADGGGTGNEGEEGKGKDDSTAAGSTQNADGSGKQPDEKPFAVFPDSATFNARIDREGKAKLEQLAKDLGYENSDQMKTAVKAAKDLEEQSKTEAQREKERADRLEQEKTEIQTTSNTRLVNSELKVFAAQAGFADPNDAVALVDRTGIAVEGDKVAGAKEAIDALSKAKPHLLGKTSRQVGSPSNPGGDGTEGLSEEEQGKAVAKARFEKKQQKPTGEDPWA